MCERCGWVHWQRHMPLLWAFLPFKWHIFYFWDNNLVTSHVKKKNFIESCPILVLICCHYHPHCCLLNWVLCQLIILTMWIHYWPLLCCVNLGTEAELQTHAQCVPQWNETMKRNLVLLYLIWNKKLTKMFCCIWSTSDYYQVFS